MLWLQLQRTQYLLNSTYYFYFFINIFSDIEIYKRTGSLSKLQKAIGHSSLAVSLTYLRGLEVSELEEEDMPMV